MTAAPDKSWEELRAAYMARTLGVKYGPVLTAIRTWNRMSDAEKIKRATRAAPPWGNAA